MIKNDNRNQGNITADETLSILVVDDDELVRKSFEEILRTKDHQVFTAANSEEALQLVGDEPLDVALIDLMLGNENGIELMTKIQEINPSILSMIVTGYGTIERAVEAMQKGAWDFLTKPFSPNMIIEKLNRIQEYCHLRREHDYRRKVINLEFAFSGIVGPSQTMQTVYEQVLRASQSTLPVLVQGETGSGKEFIAEAIHLNSKRKDKPYVVMDCTAIPDSLMEGTLFGSTRGAFTGAVDRKGLLEAADGGTLLLDEVGEIDLDMQPKLLRCLETGRFRPVGATKESKSNFRIICATNRELATEVEEGRFRKDLFYRISAMRITVPSLRERSSDIPVLANHFLETITQENNTPSVRFSPAALEVMKRYSWPGNTRQLRFVVESAYFQRTGDLIEPHHLHLEGGEEAHDPHAVEAGVSMTLPTQPQEVDFKTYRENAIQQAERSYVESLLRETGGDVREAANMAGLTREAFYRVLSRCNISASDYRQK